MRYAPDVLTAIGLVTTGLGAWMIYEPLGVLFVGCALAVVGVLAAREQAKRGVK